MDEQNQAASPVRGYSCASCSYNLVGVRIGDPCPECGMLFAISDSGQQRAGKAVASLVLGMMSIVTCMFYGLPGIVCGILAIIFAKQAREAVRLGQAPQFSLDFARAGKICGWIGIALAGVFIILAIVYVVFIFAVLGAAAGGGGFAPAPTPAPLPLGP